MKKTLFLICASLSILAISCKKNSEDPITTTKADYFQLKVGNYWIYEGFNVDTNGVATSTGKFDSAHIEKDTVIRGFTFVELWEKPYVMGITQFPVYLRDSSGYLVSMDGSVLASDFNFTDTIEIDNSNPLLYLGYVKMTGKDSIVGESLGKPIQSITSRKQIVPMLPNLNNLPIRYTYEVYGKGIGKIKTHSFFFSGGGPKLEARLVRYKVN
jgi:hypothetical protein